MAYAASIYLLQILKQLQQSDQFLTTHYPISQIHHLHGKICSLKDFLEKNSSLEDDSESSIHLESQIRETIYEAEDIIESQISAHFLRCGSARSGEENHMPIFRESLQRVIQKVDSIEEKAKKVRQENEMSVFCEDLQKVIEGINFIGTRTKKFIENMSILSEDLQRVIEVIDSVAETTKKFTVHVGRDLIPASMLPNHDPSKPAPRGGDFIVGRIKDIDELVGRVIRRSTKGLEVIPIVGIRGIGKTALAEAVYNDPLILPKFDIRARIKVSREYHKRDILLGLLRSIEALGGGQCQETEDQLAKYLYDSLKSKKFLVFLDDICDVESWNYLKELLPNYNNGSRVILTTREDDVAKLANKIGLHQVLPLTKDDSWDLLRRIVFPNKLCPELEQVAKNIARKCRGLPLAIVIIGRVLAKAGIRGWQTAASSVSTCENDGELTDVVLSLTYRSLPQHFKACLLYMGIFPPTYEIPVSKLIKLWIAEGFLELDGFQTLEDMAEEFVLQLVGRSLVSVCEQSSGGGIKTCMIDDVFRDFVKRKAEEERFFHAINKHTDGFLEDTNAQRRLCILKNIRLSAKDVDNYNSKARVSTVRSLLYSGPIHQHPLREWLDFKLLRVLDALRIRFYSFPLKILDLVQLRYLALTCNGELPADVCRLQKLQFLIVLRSLCTKKSGQLLNLPVEIWNMKKLRHLQFMGRDLPDASIAAGEILENLSTLSDVGSHSCTPSVLQRIPNLKKLGIRIESPALDAAEDFSFLSHLHILPHLRSLRCVVVRPSFQSQVVSCAPIFPPSLRKLCLSGCGFCWEYMTVIAAMPNLEVLKLLNYSFRGPDWVLDEEEFVRLKFLLLEDMDLENWTADGANFPSLARLIIRHCYKLRKIPGGIGDIITLEMIELDDCNPSTVSSVRSILELQQELGNDLQVRIPFSWK